MNIEWAENHALKPMLNTAAIQPYNALANVVNEISETVRSEKVLPKAQPFSIGQTEFLSGAWFAETVSSGVAMVIPYAIAGKCAGTAMRSLGGRVELGGALANILKSEHTAQILGAALYDGSRDLQPGEQRWSNALAGATAFGVFQAGNAFSRGIPYMAAFP